MIMNHVAEGEIGKAQMTENAEGEARRRIASLRERKQNDSE